MNLPPFLRALCSSILSLTCLATLAPSVQAAIATLSIGQSVTLSVNADGTAPFTYQWYKDGVALTGATGASHVVSNAQLVSAGVYTARVSNAAGSTDSDNATLTIQVLAVAPVILTHPASQTVSAGSPVTFSVIATGVPTPTYQWRKDGVNIAGATAASYTIAGTTTANAGNYNVVVTNTAGAVTSGSAALTVNTPAVITTQPVGQTVTAGSAVTFSVVATGTPAPTYQWRKNGTAITGATAASYTITSASLAQAGTYSVAVTNSLGTVTSGNAVLGIAAAPTITTQPVGQAVATGGTATFSVVATGSPTLTYQWLKNGTTISGATGATYTITNVSSGNVAPYSVRVSNAYGSVRSANASLTISTAPVITTQPVGQTVITGSNVTLSVTATGTPAPTYQWRKNGTAITGATGSSYVLTAITAAQAGTYSVAVTNSYGSVTSSNAVIAVNAPLPLQADFNLDGKSDLFWQNILTGDHCIWLMAGASHVSTVALGKLTTDWEVVGVSDFNGDGKSDILLQNLVTRDSSLWLMAGTTLSSTTTLGVAPTGMLMAGTGDFNADGMADILWQNVATGEYSIRFMNRLTPGASAVIGTGPAGWNVGGTGDFNGDGKPDILWQRTSDGAARVWLMNGATYASATDLSAMGAGWILGGTGDFNGDGKPDILWQNTTTGARKVALMSGLTKTGEVALETVPADWVIAN